MGKKVFYVLGLVLAFILGYFVINAIDSGSSSSSSETYNFDDSALYSSVLNNLDILESRVVTLESMNTSRYDDETLVKFKEYFRGYYDYIKEMELVNHEGEVTYKTEEYATILLELATPDYTASGKIDIYSTAINHLENKDELVDIYANKQASYLFLNDPGAVSILYSEEVIYNTKEEEFPSLYMNYILGYLDLQLLETIELLNIIIN